MNKNIVKLLAVTILVTLVGFATVASAQPGEVKPTRAVAPHGQEMKGTISSLDETTKVLKLKDATDKEHEFLRTTATQVMGTLKVGEKATVRYIVKDAKNVATAIHVAMPAAPAKPAK